MALLPFRSAPVFDKADVAEFIHARETRLLRLLLLAKVKPKARCFAEVI